MKIFCSLVFTILVITQFIYSQENINLMDMSLEDILNMEVSSVSKKIDRLQDVASSIYVITEEDIHRSGATRIQEVLNMVPGIFFSELTYNYTSEAIRCEADEYAQTVLVLIDGVPLTSPLTAGMWYFVFDIPLQQIERIEVIKGPGGTIYGANANTGIINIFTKTGKSTEGLHVSLEGGLQDYVSPFVRYGYKLSEKAYLSGYAKYLNTRGYNKTKAFDGEKVTVQSEALKDITIINKYPSVETDGKEAITAGLSLQTDISDKLKSTTRIFYTDVNNKVYSSLIGGPITIEQPIPDLIPFIADERGTEFIVSERLDYNFTKNHSLFFHSYYRNHRLQKGIGGGIAGRTRIFDFEIQDNVRLGFNDISFGGNYRIIGFNIEEPKYDISFSELKTTEILYAAFFQDKINFGSMVDLTLGCKAETWTLISNDPEFSPSIRLVLKPRQDLSFWSAFSRSITIPGYIQNKMELRWYEVQCITPEVAAFLADLQGLTGDARTVFLAENTTALSGTNKSYIAVVSRDDVKPTEYLTFEYGFRTPIIPKIVLDFSAYYAKYNNAITTDIDFMSKGPTRSSVCDTFSILPVYYANTYKGTFYGGEFIAKINPANNLRLEVSYSLFKIKREALPMPDKNGELYDISVFETDCPVTPEHIIRFRPYLDIPGAGINVSFNVAWLSKCDNGAPFNYVLQLPASEDLGITGINVDPPRNRLKLDFSIEKTLYDNQIRLMVWGRNVLADPYVEDFSEYVGIGYPHTIHRTFGGGISFNY